MARVTLEIQFEDAIYTSLPELAGVVWGSEVGISVWIPGWVSVLSPMKWTVHVQNCQVRKPTQYPMPHVTMSTRLVSPWLVLNFGKGSLKHCRMKIDHVLIDHAFFSFVSTEMEIRMTEVDFSKQQTRWELLFYFEVLTSLLHVTLNDYLIKTILRLTKIWAIKTCGSYAGSQP